MLGYRVRRVGREWRASLRRPGNGRPLFYEGPTKHGAIEALLNGVARMAQNQPGRLFGSTMPHPPVKAQPDA